MANELGIALDGVKKQIKNLRDRGILIHEGSEKAGYWRITINRTKNMGISFIPFSAIIAVLIIAFLFASLPQISQKRDTDFMQ